MAVSVRTIYEKKRTRFKIKIGVFLAGLGALGGGFVYLNWGKHVFEFREVVIEGAHGLSQEELLGGIGPVSFFASVRIEHPATAAATVSRDYWNRVLRIEIVERERFGVWCADACFWFDRSGVLFAPAPRAEGALVRRVNDHTGRQLAPGTTALEPERVRVLVAAFDMLERAKLAPEEVIVSDLSREEASAKLVSGPRILFSLRNDPSFAYEPLLNLAGELEKLAYIDIRTEQRIFLKYR